MPSADVIEYSVLTEGITRPRSIWEIMLAETSSRRLSSRTPMFWRSRSSRNRCPNSVLSVGLSAVVSSRAGTAAV